MQCQSLYNNNLKKRLIGRSGGVRGGHDISLLLLDDITLGGPGKF